MLIGFYQENKQRLQKKAPEKYQNLSEEDKSKNIVANDFEIFQKMKNKSKLSIEKKKKILGKFFINSARSLHGIKKALLSVLGGSMTWISA